MKTWLPDMDLNHDKQIQSLLCYRYTIGQGGASGKLKSFEIQSSWQTGLVILSDNVYARPHPPSLRSYGGTGPCPLPRGEGERAPVVGQNQTLRVANVFHVSRFTQHVS